jgi:uracil-DNA glycosylase
MNILKEHLGTWYDLYSQNTINSLEILVNRIYVTRTTTNKVVYPIHMDMFKLLRELPIEKIRCVIVGQDPYHDGNANGFAFGVKHNITPSLKQIMYVLRYRYPEPQLPSGIRNGNLNYLVLQGVFLFNTALTVEAGKPNSHRDYWKLFAEETISIINNNTDSVAFCFWGRQAQSYKHLVDNPSHFIAEASHPASASYNDDKWECDNFGTVNEFLKINNKKPILWR